MMWLKSCPKCQGDLSASEDAFGSYISCLQCGNHLSDAQDLRLDRWPAEAVTAGPFGVPGVMAA